jgi:hypothetical protein
MPFAKRTEYARIILAENVTNSLTVALTEPRTDGCYQADPAVLFEQEAQFSDGYRMAVQVIESCGEGNPAWAQAVLFDSAGNDIGSCVDESGTIVGNWEIWQDQALYRLEVIAISSP